MADKIKIEKNDIEAGSIELPDGYEFKIVPTKLDKIKKIDDEISRMSDDIKVVPTFEELISCNAAGIVHPYYESLIRTNLLLDQKTELQK